MNGFKKGSQDDEIKTMCEIYMCCVLNLADSAGFFYSNVFFIKISILFIHGLPFHEVSYLNPTPSFDIGGVIKTLQF